MVVFVLVFALRSLPAEKTAQQGAQVTFIKTGKAEPFCHGCRPGERVRLNFTH
jgi:hypothetical protein